jgi:hypothetical protein
MLTNLTPLAVLTACSINLVLRHFSKKKKFGWLQQIPSQHGFPPHQQRPEGPRPLAHLTWVCADELGSWSVGNKHPKQTKAAPKVSSKF